MALTTTLVVGTMATGAYSARQAKKAAGAQTAASREAIAAQQSAEGRALEMQRPFYEAGYAATAAMMDMAGLDRSGMGSATRAAVAEDRGVMIGDTLLPEGTTTKDVGKGWSEVHYGGQRVGTLRPGGSNGKFINDTGFDVQGAMSAAAQRGESTPGDISSYKPYDYKQDPGYQFRMDEGMRAIERGAAARGILNSGGAIRSATRYAQDYASNEYQKVFDRISSIAGRGQTAASEGSNIVVNTGARVGNALTNAGEARASGYVAQGNAWSNAMNQIGTAAGYGVFGKIGSGGYTPPGSMDAGGGYMYSGL